MPTPCSAKRKPTTRQKDPKQSPTSRSPERRPTSVRKTAKKSLKRRSRYRKTTAARKNSKQTPKTGKRVGLSAIPGFLDPASLLELQTYVAGLRNWLSDDANSCWSSSKGRLLSKGQTIVLKAALRINQLLHMTHSVCSARGFLPIYIQQGIAELIKALTPKGRETHAEMLKTWVLQPQRAPAGMKTPCIETDVLTTSPSRFKRVCHALSLFAVPIKYGRLDLVPLAELRAYAGRFRGWLVDHSRPSSAGRLLREDEEYVHAASRRFNHLLHAAHFADDAVPPDVRDDIEMLITQVVGKTVPAANVVNWVRASPDSQTGVEWPTKNEVDALTRYSDQFAEVCGILDRIADPRQTAEKPLAKDTKATSSAAESSSGRDDRPSAEGFTVASLRTKTTLSNSALNAYAKNAGVATPRRGQRSFRYSKEAVCQILKTIIAASSEDRVRAKCQESLDGLQ